MIKLERSGLKLGTQITGGVIGLAGAAVLGISLLSRGNAGGSRLLAAPLLIGGGLVAAGAGAAIGAELIPPKEQFAAASNIPSRPEAVRVSDSFKDRRTQIIQDIAGKWAVLDDGPLNTRGAGGSTSWNSGHYQGDGHYHQHHYYGDGHRGHSHAHNYYEPYYPSHPDYYPTYPTYPDYYPTPSGGHTSPGDDYYPPSNGGGTSSGDDYYPGSGSSGGSSGGNYDYPSSGGSTSSGDDGGGSSYTPPPTYTAPAPSYDPPSYTAPAPSYDPPPSYTAPAPSYDPPSYSSPAPSYDYGGGNSSSNGNPSSDDF